MGKGWCPQQYIVAAKEAYRRLGSRELEAVKTDFVIINKAINRKNFPLADGRVHLISSSIASFRVFGVDTNKILVLLAQEGTGKHYKD